MKHVSRIVSYSLVNWAFRVEFEEYSMIENANGLNNILFLRATKRIKIQVLDRWHVEKCRSIKSK